jgi:hypothetical protein
MYVDLLYERLFHTLKKKSTLFATKSSEIVISSKRAGSTLQKRSLLYKTKKNIFFLCFSDLVFVDGVGFSFTEFIQYTNKN